MRLDYTLQPMEPRPNSGTFPEATRSYVVIRWLPRLLVLAAVALAAGCNAPAGDPVSETDSGIVQRADAPGHAQTPRFGGLDPVAVNLSSEPRFANADLKRGELLSLACVVCHTLGPGEEHLAGPNLHGVFGRAAASATTFEYSAALRESGIIWSPAELDAWLAEPDGFVPGNNMVFAGIHSASDRSDLLAYLIRATTAGRADLTNQTR